MKNSLQRAASYVCCLGFVVLSLGAHAQSITAPLGETFKVPNLLVKHQSRLVFYRLATDKQPGAVSLYIDGAYLASLQRGAYTELCLPPSKIEIGVRMTENGRSVRDAFDVLNTLSLDPGKEVFVQVMEELNGRALMVTVRPEKALPELVKTREQRHTLSRVANAQACQDAPKPTKVAAPLSSTTLSADALFPFGKSSIDTIAPKGRRILDHLIDRIKSEFGAGKTVAIHITGHADSFGSDQGNLRLSKERAAAIKSYFVAGGLLSDSITTDGRGDKELVVKSCAKALTAANVACNKPNRRVVVDVGRKQATQTND